MRRVAGLLVVSTLALSGTASAALAPGPQIFDFEAYENVDGPSMYPGSGVAFGGEFEGCGTVGRRGGHDGGVYVLGTCGFLGAGFGASPRSLVEVFVRATPRFNPTTGPLPSVLRVSAFGSCIEICAPIDSRTFAPLPSGWTSVVLRDPGGAASIKSISIGGEYLADVRLDDVGLSTNPQPDTQITAGPGPRSNATSPSFAFAANQPGATFRCTLNGMTLRTCPAPTLSVVGEGSHTLTVAATDRWGLLDASPAAHTWIVDTTPPDTAIADAPPASTTATSAAFGLSSTDGDLAGFECSLDNGPFASCATRATFALLSLGRHVLRARAVDTAGNVDPTPDQAEWTVVNSCPPVANREQADADNDGVGDACEVLPSGNLRPVAGQRVQVSLVSGEVFVRLPQSRNSRRSRAASSNSAPPSGFVPLKGVASVPVGSTVDARNGTLRVRSAANASRTGATSRRLQAATLAAGLFRIRQARKPRRRTANAIIPTEALLRSAPGAQRICARSTAARPLKGIVRTLRVSAKGLFRTVGAASVTTGRNAIWNTSDRCDGTLTQVGRGRVTVARTAGGTRTAVVTGGRAYLIRARPFSATKGRG